MITNVYQFAKIAAMAPRVPDWFKPTLHAPPNRVLDFSTWTSFLRSDQRQWMHKYYNDEDGTWHPKFAGKKLKSMVKDHLIAWNNYYDAQKQWEQYRTEETLFQWQIYYADKIIEASQLYLDRLK